MGFHHGNKGPHFPPAIFPYSGRRGKEKIYKCQYEGCFSAFSQVSNLRKHEVNLHGRPVKYKRGRATEDLLAQYTRQQSEEEAISGLVAPAEEANSGFTETQQASSVADTDSVPDQDSSNSKRVYLNL